MYHLHAFHLELRLLEALLALFRFAAHAMTDQRRSRLSMQDWRCLPSYLSQEIWSQVLNTEGDFLPVLERIGRHVGKLGLRCPTEGTTAVVTAILLKRQGGALENRQMHTMYLNCKAHLSTMLMRMRMEPIPGDVYITSLPADPQSPDVPEALRVLAFPDGVMQPLQAYSMEDLIGIAREIPLRKTHGSISKASGSQPVGLDWTAFMQMWGGFTASMLGQQQAQRVPHEVPVTFLRPPQRQNAWARCWTGPSSEGQMMGASWPCLRLCRCRRPLCHPQRRWTQAPWQQRMEQMPL